MKIEDGVLKINREGFNFGDDYATVSENIYENIDLMLNRSLIDLRPLEFEGVVYSASFIFKADTLTKIVMYPVLNFYMEQSEWEKNARKPVDILYQKTSMNLVLKADTIIPVKEDHDYIWNGIKISLRKDEGFNSFTVEITENKA